MDFRMQPNGNRPAPSPAPTSAAPERKEERSSGRTNTLHTGNGGSQWLRILNAVLLVGIAALLVGIILAVNRGNIDDENKYVNTKNYQAVFLTNGQVYFGDIQQLTGTYLRMTNIYYLTQNGSSAGSSSSNDYSLVKLGCQQIHDPLDEMIINRDQVTFWENLSSNGKVVSSIRQFQEENPNGPNCSEVSTQTQASTSNTQGASNTSTGTSSTGSSSTTTTK